MTFTVVTIYAVILAYFGVAAWMLFALMTARTDSGSTFGWVEAVFYLLCVIGWPLIVLAFIIDHHWLKNTNI